MIKRLLLIITVLSGVMVYGQDQTSSPYSYFGIGLPTFNGSAQSRAMEGLAVKPDSIHFSFQNPAGLAALKLTTFTVGATQRFTNIKSSQAQERFRNTTFDYIAVGIPAGKLNFGFGIIPSHSVGYRLKENTPDSFSKFKGSGGLTKLFLSFGYRIKEGLRLGVQGSYNFGNIQNENYLFRDDIQYGTRETNRSDINGFQFKVGAQYETDLSKKLTLSTSLSYAFQAPLTSENQRHLATVARLASGGVIVVNEKEIQLADTEFNLPTDLRFGVGLGQSKNWFVGVEYETIGTTEYTNTSFAVQDVEFTNANVYRLGGFFIPDYSDITNYFNRIVFKAGLRYQETGLIVNGQNISEYAASFGMGLPAGNLFSNINIGVEYGQRGTTTAGLVQENFVNVFIGISFNDKWFREVRYK